MTAAEIDSLIDAVASKIGTQEIRSFVDRRRADLRAMVAAAIASLEQPPQPTKVGDRVNWYEPTPNGGIQRQTGLVIEIRKDGLLEIRRQAGGYIKLAESQAGMVIGFDHATRLYTTRPPPADLPPNQRITKAIITSEEAMAESLAATRKLEQEQRDRPETPAVHRDAVSAVEPPQPIVIHVRDKKPVTPQLPPPLPMSAYVRPPVQELFDYHLFYKGVFGRNRTEKTGNAVLLKHIPRTAPKSLLDLMPRIREILADPGMSTKPGADLVIVVKELPIELDRGFEKFLIGSGQELYRGMKSALLRTE